MFNDNKMVESKRKRTRENPLKIKMEFDEAMERLIGVKPDEIKDQEKKYDKKKK